MLHQFCTLMKGPSMFRRSPRLIPRAFGLLALPLLVGCGSGGGGSAPPSGDVVISPSAVTVLVGGTQTFTTTVSGAPSTKVSWAIAEGAAGGSIDAGIYKASATVGTYHVVATSLLNHARSATATVTVIAPSSGPLYTISELAPPPTFEDYATDINEYGDILGILTTGTDRTVVWKADGTKLYVPVFPGPPWFHGGGINDAGVIAGHSHDNQATLFDPAVGTLQTLPGFQNVPTSFPTAINNNRQIAGTMTKPSGAGYVPFFWQNGVMTPIPILNPSLRSAYDIVKMNNFGQVVGAQIIDQADNAHAFMWDFRTNVLLDLGTLGGKQSVALAINNHGVILGVSLLSDNTTSHAFLWQNGTMTDLGVPNGTGASINDNGEVVGTIGRGLSADPFYWKNGMVLSLKDRIVNGSNWRLLRADLINNQGKIVGVGAHNGQPMAFLLTPTTP